MVALACLLPGLLPAPARAATADIVPLSGSTVAGLPTAPARPALAEPFRLGPNAANDRFAAKWREVSSAIAVDRAALAACRAEPGRCPGAAQRFGEVVAQAKGLAGRARLGILNRAVNLAITYTSDLVQHGRDDVWSSPLATFASGMGDCEDYAIAKYAALLEAGMAEEDLRVVIVDERWSGLHAVAAARLEGVWLVLDNRRMALIEDRDLAGYHAIATLDGRLTPSVVADAAVGAPDAAGPSGFSEPAS